MKLLFSLIAIGIFVASNAFARIGETYEQCVKRYGAPIERDKNHQATDLRTGLEIKSFKKGDIPVDIIFYNDKAIYIEYEYELIESLARKGESSVIAGILDVNGSKWEHDKLSNDRRWLLEVGDGVISSDARVEKEGIAKSRWICNGGPENGGLIAVDSIQSESLIIVNSTFMELTLKNQEQFKKSKQEKSKKVLEGF